MPTIDARRLVLLCITAVAWIISIPWTIGVWRSGQIPYEPIIGFLVGLASLVELFTGIVQKHFNPKDAAKEEILSNFLLLSSSQPCQMLKESLARNKNTFFRVS